MPSARLSRTLPYACERLFALAADIERYPQYLPGWAEARVIQRAGPQLVVRQRLGFGLLQQAFISHATLDWPTRITVRSDDGPFRELVVEWRFEPVNDTDCRVGFAYAFRLRNALLEPVTGLLLRQSAPLVLSRFEQRARERAGGAG